MKSEDEDKVLISKIFIDDIIFGGNKFLCKSFFDRMRKEFQTSMFGEINFFIGFQVHQTKDGIYVTHSKYIKDILKSFGMDESKPVGTPMVTGCKLSNETQ